MRTWFYAALWIKTQRDREIFTTIYHMTNHIHFVTIEIFTRMSTSLKFFFHCDPPSPRWSILTFARGKNISSQSWTYIWGEVSNKRYILFIVFIMHTVKHPSIWVETPSSPSPLPGILLPLLRLNRAILEFLVPTSSTTPTTPTPWSYFIGSKFWR